MQIFNEILRDNFGRPVTNLRISITQRCNLRCFYCHKEGIDHQSKELEADEIFKAAKVALRLGINRFKLTGGEPLLRRDVCEILSKIASLGEKVEDISMTTNGVLFAEMASELHKSGLRRVNISLPSNDFGVYRHITQVPNSREGRRIFEKVIEGIKLAPGIGFYPVKINMVVLKGINDTCIPEMIELAKESKAVLQLIELQKLGIDESVYRKYHHEIDVRRLMHNRKKYLLEEGVEVEVVRPMDNSEFCAGCTRLRLTCDGKLKPCLMRNDNLVKIPDEFLNEESLDGIESLFIEAIKRREPFFKNQG
ncbi:MAG: GTP 3',8-cyclase MoaA [Candidatus Bathyarchaeia archaeon]